MLQYVDGFACSLNEAKDKLVIHFYQNEPIIEEDEEEIKVVKNKIANIRQITRANGYSNFA